MSTTTVHQSPQYRNCVVCDHCCAIWQPTGAWDVSWRIFGVAHTVPGSIDLRTTCPGCGLSIASAAVSLTQKGTQ